MVEKLIKEAMAENGRRSVKARKKKMTPEEFSTAMRSIAEIRWSKKRSREKLST